MDVKHLTLPFYEKAARTLHAGDEVLVTGTIVTARDAAHKYLCSTGNSPVNIEGVAIYHCGPVTVKSGNSWKVVAAGPTTSMREEPYEAAIIRKFKPAAIIGKGGMGSKTLSALQDTGCVYLHATGGAAAFYAECIKEVRDVHFLDEFGQPEAMWVLEVKDFPAVVTMDSHGKSLHADIEKLSEKNLKKILNK